MNKYDVAIIINHVCVSPPRRLLLLTSLKGFRRCLTKSSQSIRPSPKVELDEKNEPESEVYLTVTNVYFVNK